MMRQPRSKRDEYLQVRLTKDELLVMWTAALASDTTLSEFVRKTVLDRAHSTPSPARKVETT